MKRFAFVIAILILASVACGGYSTPAANVNYDAIATYTSGTLTALAPTQGPPTLIPLPTFPPAPTAVPTQTPPPPPPSSSGPTRIQFAQGAVSATVNGSVTFPNRLQYVLYAFKGQRMVVEITSPGNAANFSILGVSDGYPLKRLENEDRIWKGDLLATQDYIIQVAVPGGSANYSLTVTIVWP